MSLRQGGRCTAHQEVPSNAAATDAEENATFQESKHFPVSVHHFLVVRLRDEAKTCFPSWLNPSAVIGSESCTCGRVIHGGEAEAGQRPLQRGGTLASRSSALTPKAPSDLPDKQRRGGRRGIGSPLEVFWRLLRSRSQPPARHTSGAEKGRDRHRLGVNACFLVPPLSCSSSPCAP